MYMMTAVIFAAVAAAQSTQGPAKITAASTYYDRKEGYAYFSGNVSVDDGRYQLHADRAYVFMDGTNDLKRIVAIGGVAMTNENRRAYGVKASYYRDPGMVVLYGDDGAPAEVREEHPDGARVVKGKKIKFWTGSEQVEVMEAEMSTPSKGGLGDLKGLKGKIGR
jgi:lipopolysaccharide transport protein LptA